METRQGERPNVSFWLGASMTHSEDIMRLRQCGFTYTCLCVAFPGIPARNEVKEALNKQSNGADLNENRGNKMPHR
jgi:hypothetical protein